MRKLYENFHIFHFQKRIVSAETIRGNMVCRELRGREKRLVFSKERSTNMNQPKGYHWRPYVQVRTQNTFSPLCGRNRFDGIVSKHLRARTENPTTQGIERRREVIVFRERKVHQRSNKDHHCIGGHMYKSELTASTVQ